MSTVELQETHIPILDVLYGMHKIYSDGSVSIRDMEQLTELAFPSGSLAQLEIVLAMFQVAIKNTADRRNQS